MTTSNSKTTIDNDIYTKIYSDPIICSVIVIFVICVISIIYCIYRKKTNKDNEYRKGLSDQTNTDASNIKNNDEPATVKSENINSNVFAEKSKFITNLSSTKRFGSSRTNDKSSLDFNTCKGKDKSSLVKDISRLPVKKRKFLILIKKKYLIKKKLKLI